MAEANGAASAADAVDDRAESNGSGPDGAPDQVVSQGEPALLPAHQPAGRRRLQIAFGVFLALACIAAAVVSIRAFVIASTNQFSGVIEPTQAISLDFPEVGHLTSLTVHPGDRVRTGQVLARLDLVGAHAVVMAAQAATASVAADEQGLDVAQRQVAEIPAAKLASVSRAKAKVATDEADLAQARAVLDQSTISSPVNGLVMNVSGAVGDLVGPDGVQIDGSAQPSQLAPTPYLSPFSQASQHTNTTNRNTTNPLIQLAAGPTEMEAQVPESAVGQMRPGRGATVTVPALGASFGARLLRVVPDPVQGNGNVSYEVLFVLQRPSTQVLPGMSADVTVGR